MNESQSFELAISQVFGKRLTYHQLTGKNESTHHETTWTGQAQEVPSSPCRNASVCANSSATGRQFAIQLVIQSAVVIREADDYAVESLP